MNNKTAAFNNIVTFLSGKDLGEIVVDFYSQHLPKQQPEAQFVHELNNLDVNLQIESNHLIELATSLENFLNNQIVYSNNFSIEKQYILREIGNKKGTLVDFDELSRQLDKQINHLNVGNRQVDTSPDDKQTTSRFSRLNADFAYQKTKLIEIRKQITEKTNQIESLISEKTKLHQPKTTDSIEESPLNNSKDPPHQENQQNVVWVLVDRKNFKPNLNSSFKNTRLHEISRTNKFFSAKVLQLQDALNEIIYECSSLVFIVILDRYDEIDFQLRHFDQKCFEGIHFVLLTISDNSKLLKFASDFKSQLIKISIFTNSNETSVVSKLTSELEKNSSSSDSSSNTLQPIDQETDLNRTFLQDSIEFLVKHLADVDELADELKNELVQTTQNDQQTWSRFKKINENCENLKRKLANLRDKVRQNERKHDKIEIERQNPTTDIQANIDSLLKRQDYLKKTKENLKNPSPLQTENHDQSIVWVLADRKNFKSSNLNSFKNIRLREISKTKNKILHSKVLHLQESMKEVIYECCSTMFIVIVDRYDEIDFNIREFDQKCFEGIHVVILTISDNLNLLKFGSDFRSEFIKAIKHTISDEKDAVSKLKSELATVKQPNWPTNNTARIQAIDAQIELNSAAIDELINVQVQQSKRENEHGQIYTEAMKAKWRIEQNKSDKLDNELDSLEKEKASLQLQESELDECLNKMKVELEQLRKRVDDIDENQKRALDRALNTPAEYVEFDRKLKNFKWFLSKLQERKQFISHNLDFIYNAFHQFKVDDDVVEFKTNNRDFLEKFFKFIKQRDFVVIKKF